MNILHYTIGLPPDRHGGSVQYAFDLMREEAKYNNVFVLTCGDTLFRGKLCKIKSIKRKVDNIKVFKLTNPLTPTLIYGTLKPAEQYRDVVIDKGNIEEFIEKNKIEVMHLHTLMGIHKSVVEFIKSLGVKIVYTTHDFHGICPHYNLLNYNGCLCNKAIGIECCKCNANEPSDIFLRVVNSSLYHFFKNIGVTKILMKLKKHATTNTDVTLNTDSVSASEYDALLGYYRNFFSIIDKFHFNSSQTKDVFTSFIPNIKGMVINVITSGIKDKRRPVCPGNIIKLGFIGSLNYYKGFSMLKQALIELQNEGIMNIKIITYGGGKIGIDKECPLIEHKPSYKYSELSEILYHLDGTLVPSKCYETFSLVTLESLAHGRPAFVSDHVGAKDVVNEFGSEYIFSSKDELKGMLKRISQDKDYLKRYSEKIMVGNWIFTIQNHTEQIINFYRN